jgi:hypothetical protein
MFIAVLLTVAKLGDQSNMPISRRMDKEMWFMYTMELYSAIKKNEILSLAGR